VVAGRWPADELYPKTPRQAYDPREREKGPDMSEAKKHNFQSARNPAQPCLSHRQRRAWSTAGTKLRFCPTRSSLEEAGRPRFPDGSDYPWRRCSSSECLPGPAVKGETSARAHIGDRGPSGAIYAVNASGMRKSSAMCWSQWRPGWKRAIS